MRAISREVAGAWRSLRYDLRRKRSAAVHPVVAPAGRVRRRLVLATAGLVLIALAGGGLFAMVAGLLVLLDPGRPPAGLPAHAAAAPAVVSPAARVPRSPTESAALRGAASPVRTPAPVPTCACTAPPRLSPSASGTPTPSASPSPTDVSTPTPDPTPDGGDTPDAQRGADPGTTP